MGLLDALFDQNTYGGQTGGLLDLIRTTQAQNSQYQPSAGFAPPQPAAASAMPVGDYQMPRIGSMAQFTPPQADPAALPQNAQPAQGQLPAQNDAAFSNPGGLGAGLRGFASNLHTGPIGALVGAIGSAAGMQDPAQQQQKALFDAYKGAGLTPAQAMVAVLNPQAANTYLGGDQTPHIKEYHFAKKEDPSLTFAKFMEKKKTENGEYGLNYVYGTDKDGKTIAFAPGKSGDPKQVQFPEGITIARGIETIKTPTEVITRDKQSGAILSREKLDNAGKASQEVVGEAQGKAKAALANGADIDAEQTKKKIDEFVSSKGFNEVFGQLDQYRPSWTHSNEGTDALARYKQLKGTAFLSAYTMLKGGGAITDIEGQKAGDAMARLDRAQSEDEAKAALRDFREAVDIGLTKLKRAAGSGTEPAAPAAAAPTTDLKKKYGLD